MVVLFILGVVVGTAAVGAVATVCVTAVIAKLVDEVGMARDAVPGVTAAVVAPVVVVVADSAVVARGPVGGVVIAIVPAGALRAAAGRFLPWLVPGGTPTAARVTVVLAVGVVV